MPDFVTTYTYTAPSATIIFNNGALGDGTDKFWLQDIQGLDGPNGRAPVDPVPMGNGSLIHAAWLSGRTPLLGGVLLIESVRRNSLECQTALNEMEDNLRAAVESNIAPTSATLAWTPAGQSAQSLTVFHNFQPRLDIVPSDNWQTRTFVFGLISATGSLA